MDKGSWKSDINETQSSAWTCIIDLGFVNRIEFRVAGKSDINETQSSTWTYILDLMFVKIYRIKEDEHHNHNLTEVGK